MKRSYEMDLCSGPLLSKILLFSLPLILSGVLQLLFNATDIVVVGKFAGSNAMAAVGSTTSLFNLLVNSFIGISVGANVLVARHYGERDYDGVQQTIQTALLTGLIGGAILIVLGVVLARPMLTLMATPDEVIDQAVLYMQVYFIGMPATMIYNFGAAVLRAVGDTRRPLYFLMAAGVMNVLGDLLFVCILGMGVAGTAIATVLSQCVSAGLTVLCLVKTDGMCHLDLRRLHFRADKFARIMQIGLPAGMQSVIFNISNVLIQSSVNSFGAVTVAGNTAAANIEGFVYISMNALYQTSISFTSQNLGAKQYDRAKKGARFGILCSITIAELIGFVIYAAAPTLIAAFNSDPAVVHCGVMQARTIALFYFLLAFSHCIAAVLRGSGHASVPMVVMLCVWCLFRVSYITVTVRLIPDIRVIFWAYPLTWSISSVIFLYLFLKGKWVYGFEKGGKQG